MDKYELPIAVLSVLSGIGILIGIITTASHFGSLDTLACIEVIKDKSAQDILLICKGR